VLTISILFEKQLNLVVFFRAEYVIFETYYLALQALFSKQFPCFLVLLFKAI